MREDLLQSAVSFLLSNQVQSAAKEKKVQFLKSKGLNDEEIEEAFKRTGITATTSNDTNKIQEDVHRLPPKPTSLYQPIQIVYYPPAPPPRKSTKQLLSYALIIGTSTFGIAATLTMIIKRFMSRVFQKISDYQRDRYQQQTKLLSRMDSTLKSFTQDDLALEGKQTKLNASLAQLIRSLDTIKERPRPYKDLRSDVEQLRFALIQRPTAQDTRVSFGSYGGFESSYADQYQVNTKYDVNVQSIKSEIRSVKGMLLSRRNFPIVSTANAATNVPPAPTIQTVNAYHPRRKQPYRSELSNAQATTVEEVKQDQEQ